MPSIEQSQQIDLAKFERMPTPHANFQSDQSMQPRRDSTGRFNAAPIPGIIFSSPDQLRGFHLGGIIPQWRTILPPPNNNAGGSSTGGTTVVSSSSSGSTNNPPASKTASITTSVLSPAGQFTGSLSMAKSYIVLSVSVNSAARVRLYSTASAQTVDLIRPITQGAGFGTEQGIVGDIVLDTAPVVWEAQNMTGVNGDSPQASTSYITVDNLSISSMAVTVSVVFVPLQS